MKLERGVIDSYAFDLKAGEFLRLFFDQWDVDLTVDIIDPLRRKVLTVDSFNGANGPEDVPFLAEIAGTYEVRVSATSAGRYSPRIVTRRVATPRDRTRAAAVLAYFRGEEASRSGRPSSEIKKYYADAARLAGEVGETRHRADAYYRLGTSQCKDGLWSDCRDSYLRAMEFYEQQENLSGQAALLTDLAHALNQLGQPESAIRSFQRAIQLARKVNRVKIEAIALLNLGSLQLSQGQVDLALRSFERSRDLYRRLGSPIDEVRAINGCGRVYTFLGRVDQALAYHNDAWKRLKEKPNNQLLAETMVHIGDAYRYGGNILLAISYYLHSLEIFRSLGDLDNQATALNNLGLTYYRAQMYGESLDAYLQAIRIFHDHGRVADEATGWSNVGWLQIDLDDIRQSLAAFESALSISQKLNRRPVEMVAYYGLAWAERHRNNLIAAQKNAQKAVDILEELRRDAIKPELKRYILGARSNLYEFLIEILMEQHQLQPAAEHNVEAFAASEGARARSLLDSLGVLSAPPLLSMRAVQSQILDKDTILLEYHLGEEKSFLWAVTPDSYASFELPRRSKIEPLAREVYELLKTSNHVEVFPLAVRKARELSEILLGPVAGRLGNKRLLIVTPPALQYIPFAVLPELGSSDQEENSTASWPTPLVRHHQIVSAPSASVVAALRATPQAVRKETRNLLALIAAPVYVLSDKHAGKQSAGSDLLGGRFKPLRYSMDEARTISRLAGRGNVLELFRFDANRDQIMAGRLHSYKYIYFSAHGDPNPTDPSLASIVLSAFDGQGRPQEPFLRAKDIQTLDLSADLVVLGSCGSGLGEEVQGEGIVGLTQAFLTAGASRVLVSLWDLDDQATSEFMPIFYSNLLKGGKTPAAALQEAQIQMWRQRRRNAPVYWGGFVQQGEWR